MGYLILSAGVNNFVIELEGWKIFRFLRAHIDAHQKTQTAHG